MYRELINVFLQQIFIYRKCFSFNCEKKEFVILFLNESENIKMHAINYSYIILDIFLVYFE